MILRTAFVTIRSTRWAGTFREVLRRITLNDERVMDGALKGSSESLKGIARRINTELTGATVR